MSTQDLSQGAVRSIAVHCKPKGLTNSQCGGHTGFARAIAQHMPFKPDFVVPRGDKLSAQIALTNASRIYEVTKWRSPDGGSSGLGALIALWESLRISRYDIVLATGSNHSIFPSLVQRLKGAKLYVVESQDRIVTKGKAVYLLSFLSKGVSSTGSRRGGFTQGRE